MTLTNESPYSTPLGEASASSSRPGTSRGMLWAGRIIGGLPALFLLFDAVMKLAKPAVVVEGTAQMGYSEAVIIPLGVVLLLSTLLYFIPQTAVVGAILLTGYLGGAVDAHVRQGDHWFWTIFPALFGVVLWSGLCLRNERLRAAIFRQR